MRISLYSANIENIFAIKSKKAIIFSMVKVRLIQVIEYKRIPKEEFYLKIGMTSASFRGNARNSSLNSDVIEKILTLIPDLNLYWLLTGKGDMLLSDGMQDAIPADGDEIERLKQQIVSLKKEIEELKDCLIDEKERFIQALLKS